MSSRLSRSAAFLPVFVLAFASSLCAQDGPRIVGNSNTGFMPIPGSTHPLVGMATEIGRAPGSLPMERVLLQLSSSPAQEAALEQLLADQQDPASPRYHAWLTPEQFGEQFGAMQADIDTVTSWLASQGFQVTEVAAGRRTIEFSGTVQQVEAAFGTEIHRYRWNGREHIANATDISIPAALATVAKGVVSLNDFGVHPYHHFVSTPIAPQTDLSGGTRGLSPYDFAAIYDVTPLWTSGYDGTGQSIAVVGETDIKVSDVTGFRATFGLPVNNPTIILNGKDPGTVSGDETESDLDVEWAGAVAKGATIKFVTSASTGSSDGITLSAQYIVQHVTAPVMSISYGLCEAQMGSSNAFYSSLFQQAAAEGIAVFVAAGDSGSAGCDSADSATPASQGFGVSGLASTAYNVAVGGTEFNDTSSPSTYWNTSNNAQMASAKGYIPELAWNESSYTKGSSTNSLYAGGGGASTKWPRPSWQTAPGVPTGSARLIPDVSLTAAGHDGYLIEQEGSLYLVGGTSASTPSFAGLMAIVNQYTNTTNGNPNSKFYALATSVPSIFHDVTTGSNAVPCAGGSANCSAAAPSTNVGKMNGYSAGAGYDMATGLGSVDANALVMNWSGTAAGPSIVSLSPNPMTGSSASQSLTINGAGFVTGSSVQVGSVTYQSSAVSFISSSQLLVTVNVGVSAQSLSVQVTIPGGKTTNTATLTVTAPAAPAIASLSPNPMTGSSASQSLTINGAGFVTGSSVQVGSVTYQSSAVSFIGSSQLLVTVNVGVSAQSLPVQVTIPGGKTTNTATLTVTAPAAPAIASLSPNPMTGSSASQSLTINGAGFVAGSSVQVGSVTYQSSAVSFIGSSQLVVTVNVGASAQSLPVRVTIPGGKTTNTATLTVTAPAAPAITSLSPNPMTGSSSAQALIVNGTGFVSGNGLKVSVGSTVYQGSQVTFMSSTQLAANVLVGTGAASLSVQVTNPNGVSSNASSLTVTAPSTAPVITTLSPNPMTGSTSVQTLTINGSGFVSGSGLKVSVGSTVYQGSQITSASSSQLLVSVNVGASAASLPVQVTIPSGKTSNAMSLTVNAPAAAPAISTLSPNPMTGSNSPQTLTINGSGFQSGLKLSIGGMLITSNQLATLTPTQLQINVITGLNAYTYAVQVINPNGGTSNIVNLQVNAPPAPTITSLAPNPLTHAAAAQTLTINGTNFQSGTGLKVTVGNTAYSGSQVSFVSATQLKVTVTVASASTAPLPVTVVNPSGAVSNAMALTVK